MTAPTARVCATCGALHMRRVYCGPECARRGANRLARARYRHRQEHAELMRLHELEDAGQLTDLATFGALPPVPPVQVDT